MAGRSQSAQTRGAANGEPEVAAVFAHSPKGAGRDSPARESGEPVHTTNRQDSIAPLQRHRENTMKRLAALRLLRTVVAKRDPEMMSVVERMESGGPCADDERTRLCLLISDEFTATGLGEDDEPLPRGLLLEDLLDMVNPATDSLRRPFWEVPPRGRPRSTADRE